MQEIYEDCAFCDGHGTIKDNFKCSGSGEKVSTGTDSTTPTRTPAEETAQQGEMKMLEMMTRTLDAGNCIQQVLLESGVVIAQQIAGMNGAYYTGDGNPEWIGCMKASLRGTGLRTVTAGKSAVAQVEHQIMLNDWRDEVLEHQEALQAASV